MISKEAAVAHFKEVCQNLPADTEENHENPLQENPVSVLRF
jgi:hypothetical protein